MKAKKCTLDKIGLTIINNTSSEQSVSMFKSGIQSSGIATTSYDFNLSSETFTGASTVSIGISNTSNPTVVINTAVLPTADIQGVVDA
jgi:sporulation-control protein spo0M